MTDRESFLKVIKENITLHGFHYTVVSGGDVPRFVYTIGCSEKNGVELLFAGGEYYSIVEVDLFLKGVILCINNDVDLTEIRLNVSELGSFRLMQTHPSWAQLLALGVFDYYQNANIDVWQIVPDDAHYTLEIPDTTIAFDIQSNKVWQWLVRDWDYPVPAHATAIVNLPVLFGQPATEVMRWEEDEWEIFSGPGPDVPEEDMRVVALATLIGIDPSIEPVVQLEIKKGCWRENAESEWNEWS